MKINYKKSILSFILISLLGACAVHKAASNEGVSVSDITSCKNKHCLLAKGMEVVETKQDDENNWIEIYKAIARKNGINYVRAAGHGVLDVATLGLWEVVGTPIEGAMSNNRGYIIAQATYSDKNSEDIIKLRVFGADGTEAKIPTSN